MYFIRFILFFSITSTLYGSAPADCSKHFPVWVFWQKILTLPHVAQDTYLQQELHKQLFSSYFDNETEREVAVGTIQLIFSSSETLTIKLFSNFSEELGKIEAFIERWEPVYFNYGVSPCYHQQGLGRLLARLMDIVYLYPYAEMGVMLIDTNREVYLAAKKKGDSHEVAVSKTPFCKHVKAMGFEIKSSLFWSGYEDDIEGCLEGSISRETCWAYQGGLSGWLDEEEWEVMHAESEKTLVSFFE